jgi:1D-myo-inositol 3-kinase
MSASNRILLVGHYCHDTLDLRSGQVIDTLGGSVSYASSVFLKLGIDYQVISKVGDDFRYFQQLRDPPHVCVGARTTHFASYQRPNGGRLLSLKSRCETIAPGDIPTGLSFPACIVAPIAGEVPPETLVQAAHCSRYVYCDIQGFIRAFQPNGSIVYLPLNQTPYEPLLNRIHFLKVSEDELPYLAVEKVRRSCGILITRGSQGCTILTSQDELHFSARKTNEVDSTGAGDCFLAGFVAGMIQGYSLAEAAGLANQMGALAVERWGVP